MRAYDIRVLDAAAADLARLDKAVVRRVTTRIRWLADNVDHVRHEALAGELSGLFKLRVGVYRVIYEFLPDERLLLIHAIGHRRDIYRQR